MIHFEIQQCGIAWPSSLSLSEHGIPSLPEDYEDLSNYNGICGAYQHITIFLGHTPYRNLISWDIIGHNQAYWESQSQYGWLYPIIEYSIISHWIPIVSPEYPILSPYYPHRIPRLDASNPHFASGSRHHFSTTTIYYAHLLKPLLTISHY